MPISTRPKVILQDPTSGHYVYGFHAYASGRLVAIFTDSAELALPMTMPTLLVMSETWPNLDNLVTLPVPAKKVADLSPASK